jgi:MFS family permease
MQPEPLAIENPRPTGSRRTPLRLFLLISVLYMALFISALNTTIVTTALPTIATHFNSTSGYTWIGAAYVLADTASGPIWTNFSEIWGRKIVFLAAVVLFMVSSVICGCAVSMSMLIAGRALQGAAAGAIMLLVNIVISDMFDLRRRTLYLGVCDVVWAVAGAVGPVVGGLYAQYAGWRWIWCALFSPCMDIVGWLMV